MVNTIQEVFNSKYFQGITSKDEEAYYVCKEQMTNTGHEHAYIWYMLEAHGRLQGIFSFYCRDSKSWDSKVPLDRKVDAQKFKIFQKPGEFRFWMPSFLGRQPFLQPYNDDHSYS